MRVNKAIQTVLKEIQQEALNYANNPDQHRKYLTKLLRFYDQHLTQDERIYFFSEVLKNISINATINDDSFRANLFKLKFKTILYTIVGSAVVTLGIVDIFSDNSKLSEVTSFIQLVIKYLPF